MHDDILSSAIFSPGKLAIGLAEGLQKLGHEVTLFSPKYTSKKVKNIHADLSYFEWELDQRKDTYTSLLKKHPLTFITLARQAQAELIAKAFELANDNKFDLVHVYTNEEDLALIFARFCKKPVLFTHHDPYNFLAKYRNSFYKHPELNYISVSLSQRSSMPANTNFIGNVYHGIAGDQFKFAGKENQDYIAYLGRIIKPKGVHLAIQACKQAGIKLKIAGKHYSDESNDKYWSEVIEPEIDSENVEFVGFLSKNEQLQEFLSKAKALIIPSIFEEPFGMVMIEALACGTPLIGLDSGAIPEVILNNQNGILVKKVFDANLLNEQKTAENLSRAISKIYKIDRKACRADFEKRFTLNRMCEEHEAIYKHIITNS